MTEPVWLSAHVFRHDDLDELLLARIAPLMSELAADGLVRDFFYLRYWEGGPHVRLRMRLAAENAAEVRTRVAGRLGDHLRAHPSRHPLDPADYARQAAHLARIEDHPGYDRYLSPPDTIRFLPYPPEHRSFGEGPSLASVEAHFCESTAVALDTLRTPPSRRASAAMVMTLAALLSLPAGSAQAGSARTDPAPPGGRAGPMTRDPRPVAFDVAAVRAAWTRSRSELTAMAERLRGADLSATPPSPTTAWLRSVRDLRDRLDALRLDGAFSSGFPEPVAHALNRCLHLHLNRLGVPLAREARLRHLAALTIRSLT